MLNLCLSVVVAYDVRRGIEADKDKEKDEWKAVK